MKWDNYINVDQLVEQVLSDYGKGRDIDRMDVIHQPDPVRVNDIVEKLLRLLFPGYYRERVYRGFNEKYRLSVLIEDVIFHLQEQVAIVLRSKSEFATVAQETVDNEAAVIAASFIRRIPLLRDYINTDIEAFFQGDPAAASKDEVVLCYPGLYAITLNRIAHELFLMHVPLIPRMITEEAHSRTGIDIHPGATIGRYFFIDHGTGVVVGETTEIGEHVKVYQGVTLGALSTRKGQALRGVKRHPTIGDYVTIYSGASILGGETVIGDHAVIGSNAFITGPVEAGARISVQNTRMPNADHAPEPVDTDMDKEQNWEKNWYYSI